MVLGLIQFVVFVGRNTLLSEQLKYDRCLVEEVLNAGSMRAAREDIQSNLLRFKKVFLKNPFRVRSQNISI